MRRPYDFRSSDLEAVGGVSACPELRDALLASPYVEGGDWPTVSNHDLGPVEDVAFYRKPEKREAYVYRLSSHRASDGQIWWRAYGEYCPAGRTATDADYVFLDGGGYFASRSAALWAIHLWLAHLHRADSVAASPSREIHHGV
jgi:hypothetical protein